MQALRDLDGPHVRALERIRRAEDAAAADEDVGPDEKAGRHERISDAVHEAGQREPIPVIAVLIRTGVALQATLFDGGLAVYRVSAFGRALLEDLHNASDSS